MKNMHLKKSSKSVIVGIVILIFLVLANNDLLASEKGSKNNSELSPKSILDIMERVADWQIDHPSKHPLTDWTQGAYDNGMMALAGISGNSKYINSMLKAGEANKWRLGPREYMADDQCVGQMYVELYMRYRENKMIDSVKHRFDEILSHPSKVKSLDFSQPGDKKLDLWSCAMHFTWRRLRG